MIIKSILVGRKDAMLSPLLEIEEEVVSFYIAIVALYVFDIVSIGGLVIFLLGRRKQAKGIPK